MEGVIFRGYNTYRANNELLSACGLVGVFYFKIYSSLNHTRREQLSLTELKMMARRIKVSCSTIENAAKLSCRT